MGFEGIADQAATDAAAETTTTEQSSDNSERSASTNNPVETSNDKRQVNGTPGDIPDLAQLAKFRFEGQEITYDDLRRSYLRHKDYTQKTTALAEERKFNDNLRADLGKIQADPSLIAEFKKIYPEKYHWHLDYIQQQQQGQQTSQAQSAAQLPPELLSRIEKQEQMLKGIVSESQESQQSALGSLFETMESKFQTKYPQANLVTAYSAFGDYLEEQGVPSKEILKSPAKFEAQFEQYVKASHEATVKQFAAWQKQQVKNAREVNNQASDIGRGSGQAPTTSPERLRLKDVGDAMMRSNSES